jgi:hypothetical protein
MMDKRVGDSRAAKHNVNRAGMPKDDPLVGRITASDKLVRRKCAASRNNENGTGHQPKRHGSEGAETRGRARFSKSWDYREVKIAS